MNFEIQTTSYFDVEAKRLAKRHRSFIDDLQDFRESLVHNEEWGEIQAEVNLDNLFEL